MNRNSGFTLVELMVGLAIAAVIISLAVPSFNSTIRNNRIATMSNEVISAMLLARSEALKRSQTVSVCSTTDGTTCANSTTWETGWLVLDANSNVIRRWDQITGNATLRGQSSSVQYLSSGFVNAATVIQLRTSDCTGNEGRDISISVTGRASVAKVNCP